MKSAISQFSSPKVACHESPLSKLTPIPSMSPPSSTCMLSWGLTAMDVSLPPEPGSRKGVQVIDGWASAAASAKDTTHMICRANSRGVSPFS